MIDLYSINRRHRIEHNSLVLWDHIIPNSLSLIDSLKEHHYCSTKTISQNPECLVACFSILGKLLIDEPEDEIETQLFDLLEIEVPKTSQTFKSFQTTDRSGAIDCGVTPSNYTKAKKSLIDLGLIKVEFKNKPTLDAKGRKTFANLAGSTYSPTSKLENYFFKYYPEEFSIPVEFTSEDIPQKKKSKNENPSKKQEKEKEETKTKFKNEGSFTFTASKKIYLPANGMKQEVFDMAKKLFGYDSNRNHAVRGVFIFIDLLRFRYSRDPDDMGILLPDGNNWLIVPDEDYEFTEEFLAEKFSNGTGGNPNTVSQVKQILLSNRRIKKNTKDRRKGLGWIKQQENYMVGKRGDSFRFNESFYHGSTDPFSCDADEAYEIKNQKLTTNFEVLKKCSLDPVALKTEFFEEVCKQKKWKKMEKRKWHQALHNFDYNKGWFNQAREGGRVSTAIVGMPSVFRDHILIDGEPTVEVDIQSAHSLFIAHTKEFREEKFESARQEWINLVSTGDIYLHLAGKAEKVGANLPPKGDFPTTKARKEKIREIFKRILNAYLNGGGQRAFNKVYKLGIPFKKHMEKWFPELHQVVQQLLDRYSDQQPADIPPWDIKRNGAAIRLQQIESEIMGTHWMCNGHIPCISIHDGLLCKDSDADRLIKAVKKRAEKLLGFPIVVERK